jgi:tetratricopeptide (TPR) repeat protein
MTRLLPYVLSMVCLLASSAAIDSASRFRLTESTHRALSAVDKLLRDNRAEESLRRLKKLAVRTRGNAYEQAVVYQAMGHAYHELGNENKAIKSFEKALKDDVLPKHVARSVSYNLAQLLISVKQYRAGLTHLQRWLAGQKSPSAEALFLAATAHYGSGECKQALPYAKRAIAEASRPQEAWYGLSLSCYYELGQYRQALTVLKELIRRFPHRSEYWTQLAGVYQHLENDKKAAAILELAYGMDMLGETEMLRLVRLYLYLKAPYRAARLLQAEMNKGRISRTQKHWTLLADSLWLAEEREQSLSALRKAAELSSDGNRHYRLGRALYDLERWEEAVAALDLALEKKGLKQPELARLLLGIAAFHAGDEKHARAALKRALRDEMTRDQARWWLGRLDAREEGLVR